MRYEFIIENEPFFPVEKMCKCMKVSKNSFYYWLKNKDLNKMKQSKHILLERIKILFKQSKGVYGSPRIKKMLDREGLFYARSYIAFLMHEMGLKSVLRRKYVVTTDSKHSLPIAENKLDRNFSSIELGEKWVSDITYIRVNDQWNYLTTIMDLADRKIIGWVLSEDMTTENTILKAWYNARKSRNIKNLNWVFNWCQNFYGSKLLVDHSAGFGGWVDGGMDGNKTWFKGLLSAVQK
jgi:hypothetical protein